MVNRNQRTTQKNDDRKGANSSLRNAARGPGASPKNVPQTAKNVKEEKGEAK